MPVKPPPEPSVESMDGEFRVVTATIRGVKYVIRELPADDYEKCLKSATGENRQIDNQVMLRLMLDKALVEPKITAAELWKKPFPIVRKLNDIVDELHYTPVETDEEREEREAEEEKKKGEGQG